MTTLSFILIAICYLLYAYQDKKISTEEKKTKNLSVEFGKLHSLNSQLTIRVTELERLQIKKELAEARADHKDYKIIVTKTTKFWKGIPYIYGSLEITENGNKKLSWTDANGEHFVIAEDFPTGEIEYTTAYIYPATNGELNQNTQPEYFVIKTMQTTN